VVLAILEHAVLMDAGLVRERVLPHDRLVHLHREPGDLRHQATGGEDLFGDHAGDDAEALAARLDRHHHLFHRRVARALAESVDPAPAPARWRVHPTSRAPFSPAASELAVAMRRSSGQCALQIPRAAPGPRSRKLRKSPPSSSGRMSPVVSGTLMTRAPASITA